MTEKKDKFDLELDEIMKGGLNLLQKNTRFKDIHPKDMNQDQLIFCMNTFDEIIEYFHESIGRLKERHEKIMLAPGPMMQWCILDQKIDYFKNIKKEYEKILREKTSGK